MRTSYLFGLPFVTLPLQGDSIDLLLDTGFNGSLLLPKAKIKQHGLPQIALAEFELADGHIAHAEVFEAWIDWLGKKKRVEVISGESDFMLLGMELLKDARTIISPIQGELSIQKS